MKTRRHGDAETRRIVVLFALLALGGCSSPARPANHEPTGEPSPLPLRKILYPAPK